MKENRSLFQISADFRSVIEQSFLQDDFDEVEQKELLDMISMELEEKTDSVAAYARHLIHEIDVAKAESDRIKSILDQRKKNLEKYQNYILACMDMIQESKIEGETSKISIRKPSKVVTIGDEKLIPAQYLITEEIVKIDKMWIKEQLKNGHKVPGAALEDGKRSVTFK